MFGNLLRLWTASSVLNRLPCKAGTFYIGIRKISCIASCESWRSRHLYLELGENGSGAGRQALFVRALQLQKKLVSSSRSRQLSALSTVGAKKKMPKLTEQERSEQLNPLLNAGWTLVNGRDAIYKEYMFKNFNEAFSFMTSIAMLAERMDHHPEWFNVYNKVQVTMSTHDVGGLSAKDIKVANFMEKQAKRYL